MQWISSYLVFCSGNSLSTSNNTEASRWKPLCLLYKWTLVYFIAHFSSIWKWNDALSSLVCLFVLSSRDNERKIRIARVLGTFVEAALMALFPAKRKGGLDERDVQCHRQPKFSFLVNCTQISETMIALFVLICICYLKDKIIWLYNLPFKYHWYTPNPYWFQFLVK